MYTLALHFEDKPGIYEQAAALCDEIAAVWFGRIDGQQFGQVLFEDQSELAVALQFAHLARNALPQRGVFDLGDQVVDGGHI